MSFDLETCVGCGLQTERVLGDVHRYMLSSPKCWALYGELLAREYSDPEYMYIHALSVDAYALQHPGDDNPQAVSSVYVHLLSLYAYFKEKKALIQLPLVKKQIAEHSKSLPRLIPPIPKYRFRIVDTLNAETAKEHIEIVTEWARDVYDQWSAQHQRAEVLYKKWVRL